MKRTKYFSEVSKNLIKDAANNFIDHQNNFIENSGMMSNAAKSFDYNSLSVLHSNFDDPTRLFSGL